MQAKRAKLDDKPQPESSKEDFSNEEKFQIFENLPDSIRMRLILAARKELKVAAHLMIRNILYSSKSELSDQDIDIDIAFVYYTCFLRRRIDDFEPEELVELYNACPEFSKIFFATQITEKFLLGKMINNYELFKIILNQGSECTEGKLNLQVVITNEDLYDIPKKFPKLQCLLICRNGVYIADKDLSDILREFSELKERVEEGITNGIKAVNPILQDCFPYIDEVSSTLLNVLDNADMPYVKSVVKAIIAKNISNDILKSYPNMRFLHDLNSSHLSLFTSLKVLDLRSVHVVCLLDKCPNLERLYINNIPDRDIAGFHQQLESIQVMNLGSITFNAMNITSETITTLAEKFPQLQYLSISDGLIKKLSLLDSLKNLTELIINYNGEDSKLCEQLLDSLIKCNNLVRLNLDGTKVDVNQLTRLIMSLTSLQYLSVKNCGVGKQTQRRDRRSNDHGVGGNYSYDGGEVKNYNLTELDLYNGKIDDRTLQGITLLCPNLSVLSVENCTKLTMCVDVEWLHCSDRHLGKSHYLSGTKLSKLCADGTKINDEALYNIIKNCEDLEHISIKGCKNITFYTKDVLKKEDIQRIRGGAGVKSYLCDTSSGQVFGGKIQTHLC